MMRVRAGYHVSSMGHGSLHVVYMDCYAGSFLLTENVMRCVGERIILRGN